MADMITLQSLRFLDGYAYGVAGWTALAEFTLAGPPPGPVLDRLESRAGLAALHPSEPLPGPGEGDWVAQLLVGGRGSDRVADLTAALSVAIQLWARSPVGRAEVIGTAAGRFRLALPWRRRTLLAEALEAAILCLSGDDTAPGHLAELLGRMQRDTMSPNSLRFGVAALARDMPVTVLNGQTLQIGWGAHARQFQSSFTDRSATLGERLARNKYHCNLRLGRAALPVPDMRLASSPEAARAAAEALGWPVVVKPVALDQGAGVHVGVAAQDELDRAYAAVAALDDRGVMIERLVPGDDHRMLVVEGRLLMASRRIPGGVTGDGETPVRALLERLNADPRRGTDLRSILVRIALDDEALACLAEAGLDPDAVPEAGRFVALRRTANISTGGTAVDVTDRVHPENRAAAIRAARIVGLDIAGVDFICPDISVSWRQGGGAICEVNGQPGFRPHWLSDPARDINGEILDQLFADRPARIPTAAITGTNGKTTTAMMLHHIWRRAGRTPGVCTTVGTWIGPDRIDHANLSGVPGATLLFTDPGVEAAVLEMPRKGLMAFGNACDRYDVAALLNVQDDHIGQDGINTLEEMARVKSQVLMRARDAIVVNAEDPLCLEVSLAARAPRHILVAMDPGLPAMAEHLARGGDGVFVQPGEGGGDHVIFARGARRAELMPVAGIPATLDGRVRFNVMNAMFAAALADAQGLPAGAIRAALGEFEGSREMNPGRYDMVGGFPFQLIVDYAHNPSGITEFCRFVRDLPVTGSRRLALRILGNSDPRAVGDCAAHLVAAFDRIWVLSNPGTVRKYNAYPGEDPVGEMLRHTRDTLLAHGGTEEQVVASRSDAVITDEVMAGAAPGDLVALLADPDLAYGCIDRFRAGTLSDADRSNADDPRT